METTINRLVVQVTSKEMTLDDIKSPIYREIVQDIVNEFPF